MRSASKVATQIQHYRYRWSRLGYCRDNSRLTWIVNVYSITSHTAVKSFYGTTRALRTVNTTQEGSSKETVAAKASAYIKHRTLKPLEISAILTTDVALN